LIVEFPLIVFFLAGSAVAVDGQIIEHHSTTVIAVVAALVNVLPGLCCSAKSLPFFSLFLPLFLSLFLSLFLPF